MSIDWAICVDDSCVKHLVKDKKYLIRWNGNYATVQRSEDNPYDLANGSNYKRKRFKLVSTMNKEIIPQITNYLIIQEDGEIARFQTPDGVEGHIKDVYEANVYGNDQILFVYDNGHVTQKYLVDVIKHKPILDPVFK